MQSKSRWMMTLTLLSASALCCALVAFSGLTRQHWPTFLVWNLFLAWIPLAAAWLVQLNWNTRYRIWLLGGLWLLFFPNAPYLLTDLYHVRWVTSEGGWLMTAIYITFAITGLFVGLTSLTWMHWVVRERLGPLLGWLFVSVSLAASGFGVYIGRFLRFNSWDIFTDPLYVVLLVKQQMFSPQTFTHTWGLSLTFAFVTGFSYLIAQQMGASNQISNH